MRCKIKRPTTNMEGDNLKELIKENKIAYQKELNRNLKKGISLAKIHNDIQKATQTVTKIFPNIVKKEIITAEIQRFTWKRNEPIKIKDKNARIKIKLSKINKLIRKQLRKYQKRKK